MALLYRAPRYVIHPQIGTSLKIMGWVPVRALGVLPENATPRASSVIRVQRGHSLTPHCETPIWIATWVHFPSMTSPPLLSPPHSWVMPFTRLTSHQVIWATRRNREGYLQPSAALSSSHTLQPSHTVDISWVFIVPPWTPAIKSTSSPKDRSGRRWGYGRSNLALLRSKEIYGLEVYFFCHFFFKYA